MVDSLDSTPRANESGAERAPPADHRVRYLTFSPDLLDNEDMWPTQRLKDLCTLLRLWDGDDRDEMIEMLRDWHVSKQEEFFRGGNFYFLPVKATEIHDKFLSPFKRLSLSRRKPILKKRPVKRESVLVFEDCESEPEDGQTTNVNESENLNTTNSALPLVSREGGETDEFNQRSFRASFERCITIKRASVCSVESSDKVGRRRKRSRGSSHLPGQETVKGVQFSPFNKVELISPRNAGDNAHIRRLYRKIHSTQDYNDEDEDENDDEYDGDSDDESEEDRYEGGNYGDSEDEDNEEENETGERSCESSPRTLVETRSGLEEVD